MQIQETLHPRVCAWSFALSVSGSGLSTIAAHSGHAHEPKFFPLTTI